MARFYGEIGYGEAVEEPPGSGVYVDRITEVAYYGDVIRNSRKLEQGEGLNSDISLGNSISIVADEYANAHFHAIRYIRWNGGLWTVTTVTVQAPRLILALGEVYNGPHISNS
jgi:hypothetical protein